MSLTEKKRTYREIVDNIVRLQEEVRVKAAAASFENEGDPILM